MGVECHHTADYSLTVSPPRAEPKASQAAGLMLLVKNRVEPSAKAPFTPPECLLRAKKLVGLAAVETSHGGLFGNAALLQ